MRKTVAIFILLATTFWLSGCSSDELLTDCKWIMTKKGITITRQFNDDGTTHEWVLGVRVNGVYTINSNEISATMTSMVNEENGKSMDFFEDTNWRWSYSIKGDKLILIDLELGDGEELIYIRE